MPGSAKLFLKGVKAVVPEALLIILLLFLFNNYIKYSPVTLSADGIGYYDYLPSCFLRGDLVRKDAPLSAQPQAYARIPENAGYVEAGDRMVDKYTIGTAMLELPFFCWAKFQSPPDASGYEPLFQFAIFCAAIAYLFFGLLFTKYFLRSFGIGRVAVFASQFALVLCTPVTHYVNQDAGFSHIYSFFAIAAFLYFARAYFLKRSVSAFGFACFFLALVFLLRQVNIVVVLILPLLAGGWSEFRSGMLAVFTRYKMLIAGVLIMACMIFLQLIVWYLQTGKWIVYSYGNETFDFTDPHVLSILFSYKKGLFVYTPFLFVSIVCTAYWAVKRNWFLFFHFLGFFFLLTYILSSWWTWEYGASYGQRVYVDFLPLLVLPFAVAFHAAGLWLRILLQCISIAFACVNCIQVYQYSQSILHWADMNEERYWRVFLKTDDKYRGWLWKAPMDLNGFSKLTTYRPGNLYVRGNGQEQLWDVVFDSITRPGCETIIRFSFENAFHDSSDMEVAFSIEDTVEYKNQFWSSLPLIQFGSATDKGIQRGTTDVALPVIAASGRMKLAIYSFSKKSELLRNCAIDIYIKPVPKQ